MNVLIPTRCVIYNYKAKSLSATSTFKIPLNKPIWTFKSLHQKMTTKSSFQSSQNQVKSCRISSAQWVKHLWLIATKMTLNSNRAVSKQKSNTIKSSSTWTEQYKVKKTIHSSISPSQTSCSLTRLTTTSGQKFRTKSGRFSTTTCLEIKGIKEHTTWTSLKRRSSTLKLTTLVRAAGSK